MFRRSSFLSRPYWPLHLVLVEPKRLLFGSVYFISFIIPVDDNYMYSFFRSYTTSFMQIAISISNQTPLIVAFPCVCMWFLTFFTSLLRIHKNWDVCKFNCLSLTESWEELSISERNRNWTGGKVEICISKVKEEVFFVMQSQHRRSVVQKLLIDFCQQVFWGIIIFFLPTLYDQNARLCFFFSWDCIVDGTRLVWKGKENHPTNWHYLLNYSQQYWRIFWLLLAK